MSEEEFLQHFGVKGMKWGVRKERDVSTESKALRKASSKSFNSYMMDKSKDDLLYRAMTKDEYNSLSTGREFLNKNSTLFRVTKNSDSTLKGKTYVSQLPEDATFYRAALPAMGPQNKGLPPGAGAKKYQGEHYEIEMTTIKKLSAPSEKERVDAFLEILDEPSVKVGNKAPVTGREYLTKAGYAPLFSKKYDTQEFGFRTYYDFVRGQGGDTPINTAYFNKIRSKGFDVISDDYDRGKLTKAPLILLNPEGTHTVKSVRKLTTDEINRSQRELIEGEK